MKMSLNGINRLEIAEEMFSELEGRLIKTITFEKQGGKRMKKERREQKEP